ncbi:MAG: hypothetical protein JXQ90_03420 [Cyclobacteriaceae bacterium]
MSLIATEYADACKSDRFCQFVSREGAYEPHEVEHLQTTIISKKLSQILYVSVTLAVWSTVAMWVDMVILPFIIVYTISFPGAVYYPLLFPVVWAMINAAFKFVYVTRVLGDVISTRDRLLAVLPYAGAAFLLKEWFVGDTLLRRASLDYISFHKKKTIRRVLSFVGLK